jgi:hypothetical protein
MRRWKRYSMVPAIAALSLLVAAPSGPGSIPA